MSCYYPRLAYKQGMTPEGTQKLKFLPERVDFDINRYRQKYGEDLYLLPCGKCLGCKVDKARDWSTRCVLESLYFEVSSFITLTYSDDKLPTDFKLHREHVNEFLENLKNRGFKFRYFGCGEYGSQTHRPHYHVILFGYMPSDLKFYSIGSNGDFLYFSKELENIWSRGFVIVGSMSEQSAGYVARYTTKKLDDDDSFIFMSTHPGIGFQYLKDNAEIIVKTDKVYGPFGDSRTAPVPRYFNRFLEKWYPDEYSKLQANRIKSIRITDLNSMINMKTGHLEILKVVKAQILDDKLSKLGRN